MGLFVGNDVTGGAGCRRLEMRAGLLTNGVVERLRVGFRGCYAFQARALHMRAIVMQAKAM
jgi:hypothetical protein